MGPHVVSATHLVVVSSLRPCVASRLVQAWLTFNSPYDGTSSPPMLVSESGKYTPPRRVVAPVLPLRTGARSVVRLALTLGGSVGRTTYRATATIEPN
jgi:hypothetical protein